MVEIIAEVAQGFEGHFRQAELLAHGAIRSEADAVKFQLVIADELATPDYVHYSLFKSLELKFEDWKKLAAQVHRAGKKIYFDVFGSESLQIARDIGADGIKISTTEFYNEALIKQGLEAFSRVYISIGGIPLGDVQALIKREDLSANKSKICFMYGFQAEPTPLESNNLLRFNTLKKELPGFQFGFMDHSVGGDSDDGMYLPIMALPLGIVALEKHITLDYVLELEDYVSALPPERFQALVRLIRKMELVLGTSDTELTALENEYRRKAAKVVVAREDLSSGQVMDFRNVVLKRVGDKHKSKTTYRSIGEVLGRKLQSPIGQNEPLSEDLF